MNPRIVISYSAVTPESAAEGDFSDTGWEDEDGMEMSLDEDDIGEGLTLVGKTLEWLVDEGVVEASASEFHQGVWYSASADVDYRTGEEKTLSYHLKDFTEAQERDIFRGLKARRLI